MQVFVEQRRSNIHIDRSKCAVGDGATKSAGKGETGVQINALRRRGGVCSGGTHFDRYFFFFFLEMIERKYGYVTITTALSAD